MNVSYPKGTWPVVITDLDVKNITDDHVQFIGNSIVDHGVVVIRGVALTAEEECNFCNSLGTLEPWLTKKERDELISQGVQFRFIQEHPEELVYATTRESKYLQSVTGKLNDRGKPGMHGMKEELNWHAGNPFNYTRPQVVYLYSVYGSAGSRTSYINSAEAYNDLSSEWKDRIANLKLRCRRGYEGYSTTGEVFGVPSVELAVNLPVIHVTQKGEKLLFFPFNQVLGFANWEGTAEEEQEIMSFLKEHMTQEKYIYHHDWQDGDLLVWDNYNGVHKRWAFDGMEQRLLHRAQFNLEKVKFINSDS